MLHRVDLPCCYADVRVTRRLVLPASRRVAVFEVLLAPKATFEVTLLGLSRLGGGILLVQLGAEGFKLLLLLGMNMLRLLGILAAFPSGVVSGGS